MRLNRPSQKNRIDVQVEYDADTSADDILWLKKITDLNTYRTKFIPVQYGEYVNTIYFKIRIWGNEYFSTMYLLDRIIHVFRSYFKESAVLDLSMTGLVRHVIHIKNGSESFETIEDDQTHNETRTTPYSSFSDFYNNLDKTVKSIHFSKS